MSAKPKPFSERTARDLLARYDCPVPYPAVRTLFLGSIASPLPTISPIFALKQLWAGELPTFRDMDSANELIGTLVNGLWNHLSKHQEPTSPFRLTRIAPARTQKGLHNFSCTRREEVDRFIDGLFGGQEEVDFPESASVALDHIRNVRGLLAGTEELAANSLKPALSHEVAETIELLISLSRILESEINTVVLSCVSNRRALISLGQGGGTLH